MRKMGAETAIAETLPSDFVEIKDECEALRKYFEKEITFEVFR